MKIHFAESNYEIDGEFRKKYTAEVRNAYSEVGKLLPFGSPHVNFFVQPREYGLIKESQDNGKTYNSEFIELAFNPTVSDKKLQVILNNVRATVFHEMNHAARFNIPIWHKGFLEHCILEGLATAFERDYCGSAPLYGTYPEIVEDWLREIIDLGEKIDWDSYTFAHPDGRRWIAYKVGTYIIDQAKKNSGKSVIDLTKLDCPEILNLAQIQRTC